MVFVLSGIHLQKKRIIYNGFKKTNFGGQR